VNCLDAETLAAWFDGGLSGAALEDVQSHVATCARCQALLGAMGRTRVAVPAPQPERNPRWWLAWTVPAAAAATALVIWIAVPRQTNVALNPSPSAELQKQEASPQSTLPPAPAQAESTAPAAAPATPARQTRAKADAVAAPPAATPQTANDALQQAPAPLNEAVTVRSAAAPAAAERREAERQGAAAGQLQARAAFANNLCGPMWPAPPSDVAAQVTAGSSPSTAVCWIVGRAGTILRSTDQRTWQRLTFLLTVDLTSVTATDAQSASIVTADGRTFLTVDGGVTWIQR
jgi:putative zinc finger protein